MPADRHEVATLGGGCFWCREAVFLDLRGVHRAESGYAGGRVPNPTYEQVCTGTTSGKGRKRGGGVHPYARAGELVTRMRGGAMPRAPRLYAPEATVHVVARGNNREFYFIHHARGLRSGARQAPGHGAGLRGHARRVQPDA